MTVKRFFLMTIIIGFFLLFAGYFLLAFYYRTGFSPNTWINGVYCTGKTAEEVNSELLLQMEAPIVTITDRYGESASIDMSQMNYKGDFMEPLNRYMAEQNPLLWVDNLTFHRHHELKPQAEYDEELFRQAFEELSVIQRESQRSVEYRLGINVKEGWKLYDGLTGRLDVDRAYELVDWSVKQGQYEIDLSGMDCYYDIPLTPGQEEIRRMGERVMAFQSCGIVYDMGDEMREFSPEELAFFLQREQAGENVLPCLDENGQFILDEAAIKEYVKSLAEEYDTYNVEREFTSTRGDVITINGGTYGTRIDQKAEVAYLMDNLLREEAHAGSVITHIPEYEREANVRGRNDIGDTYIEVDMTEQKLYYYVEGELKLETDVVTGNMKRRMGTPEGVNYVYSMQTNRILRGPGYASPVKYWMPVNGNIGIHDASWRSEFGGSIYETNGSHGCVNLPSDKMKELYGMTEIGTPVVMFY